jgi:hypothetical protein
LKKDGTVVSVGYSDFGAMNTQDWENVVAVSAALNCTLGLKSDGTVLAAGQNTNGRLDVSGWTDIVSIAAAEQYSVGLKADGTVVLADSSNNPRYSDVTAWRGIIAISAGAEIMGLKADGTVVTTGNPSYPNYTDVSGWVLKTNKEAASQPVNLVYNEEKVSFIQPILLRNGYFFFPLERLMEIFGGTPDWNPSRQTITYSFGGPLSNNTIEVSTRDWSYTINGVLMECPLEFTPFIEDSWLYVNLDYITNGLGLTVGWDSETSTISITD